MWEENTLILRDCHAAQLYTGLGAQLAMTLIFISFLWSGMRKAPHCPASRRAATQCPVMGVLGLVTKNKWWVRLYGWVQVCVIVVYCRL